MVKDNNDDTMAHPWGNPGLKALDRAADELRRAQPVIIADGRAALLALPLESLDDDGLSALQDLADNRAIKPGILITAERAGHLKIPPKGRRAVFLPYKASWELDVMLGLGDPTLDLANPLSGPFAHDDRLDSDVERAALSLLKIARLLPAAFILPHRSGALDDWAQTHNVPCVNAGEIDTYALQKSDEMRLVASAHVPLEGAEHSVIKSFRPASGGPEHLAIIIGDPDLTGAVLTRLHSECFTGDLLASLKCDCGTQLKEATRAIETEGGGILLYMAQEGRGVGLTSKLKAYALQDQGFDTVDANLRLGFAIDERFFAPAAEILSALGVKKVRLMTNNPAKVKALEGYGIEVSERVPHAFPPNSHNEDYLRAKKKRTGHLL